MNEQEVRTIVREAIERHLGRPDAGARGRAERVSLADARDVFSSSSTPGSSHSSHILLKVLPGSEIDDGMCLIEPAVGCNHCGFCQSYGH
jgi:hypothetical protein